MGLLEKETVIGLTTVARVNIALGRENNTNGLAADKNEILFFIKYLSRAAMIQIMKRAIQKKSRTEQFDVALWEREFWVLASPIHVDTDIDTDITIHNNTNKPRDFTNSADEISADYIICDYARREEGCIYINTGVSAGVNTLQIAYTGGMATEAAVSGTNGSCTKDEAVLTSAGQTFSAKGIAAGDVLAITESGDDNHGIYTVVSVDSETELTVTPAFSATATGLDYELITGGTDTIVGLYPDIVEVMDLQCRYMLSNKGGMGISSEGIAGMNFTFHRPVNWLDPVRQVLESHARRV